MQDRDLEIMYDVLNGKKFYYLVKHYKDQNGQMKTVKISGYVRTLKEAEILKKQKLKHNT